MNNDIADIKRQAPKIEVSPMINDPAKLPNAIDIKIFKCVIVSFPMVNVLQSLERLILL